MLTVAIPRSRHAALSWVVEYLFERLGTGFELSFHDAAEVVISDSGAQLVMSSQFPDLKRTTLWQPNAQTAAIVDQIGHTASGWV